MNKSWPDPTGVAQADDHAFLRLVLRPSRLTQVTDRAAQRTADLLPCPRDSDSADGREGPAERAVSMDQAIPQGEDVNGGSGVIPMVEGWVPDGSGRYMVRWSHDVGEDGEWNPTAGTVLFRFRLQSASDAASTAREALPLVQPRSSFARERWTSLPSSFARTKSDLSPPPVAQLLAPPNA